MSDSEKILVKMMKWLAFCCFGGRKQCVSEDMDEFKNYVIRRKKIVIPDINYLSIDEDKYL